MVAWRSSRLRAARCHGVPPWLGRVRKKASEPTNVGALGVKPEREFGPHPKPRGKANQKADQQARAHDSLIP